VQTRRLNLILFQKYNTDNIISEVIPRYYSGCESQSVRPLSLHIQDSTATITPINRVFRCTTAHRHNSLPIICKH